MPTFKEFFHNEEIRKLEPKLAKLIDRIGRVDHIHHTRLVNINFKFKNGEHISDKDVDFIVRLYETI